MNKLFFMILAICLISVHAFVKRDAPAETKSAPSLGEIQKGFGEFFDNINDKVKDVFNPDKLKENFNKFVDDAKSVVDNIQNKEKKTA